MLSCQSPLAVLSEPIPVPTTATVTQRSTFSYYGNLDLSVSAAAAEYLASHTDASREAASQCLERFLKLTHADCVGDESEKAACWLTLRLTHASDKYKVPCWHQDGRMYPYDSGRDTVHRSKYGTTLLGPFTLMLPSSERVLAIRKESTETFYPWRTQRGIKFTAENQEEAWEKERAWLAEQYKYEDRVRFERGEVVRFTWGREDSPVHSEPDLVSDRMFMTVLYGSEGEIQRMCEWRKEGFGKVVVVTR